MTLLLLGLLSPAFAEEPTQPLIDWENPDWDALRAELRDVCRKTVRSPSDMVGVIAAEQAFGHKAARGLLDRAETDLPTARMRIVAILVANDAPEDDIRLLATSFGVAENVYLQTASEISHEAAGLEFDKTLYVDEKPATPKARKRLVEACVERMVNGFEFGTTAVRVNNQQMAFLQEAYARVASYVREPLPELPAAPAAPTETPAVNEVNRPPPSRRGPTP